MSEQDLRYWVGFNKVPGVGTARLRALLDYFGDLEIAWHAPSQPSIASEAETGTA